MLKKIYFFQNFPIFFFKDNGKEIFLTNIFSIFLILFPYIFSHDIQT